MNFIVPKCRDKELDLLLTGACPAIVREGNAKSQSAKRATDIKNKKKQEHADFRNITTNCQFKSEILSSFLFLLKGIFV
ncbi:MAG: hypothetical protein CO170_04385 [candidate division SR1 bacterium CG_4_9_14_3_um_filter_40_9]|nr:MAG: hypothetical protein CO170_04385 [candidate division SR1 bacterium CG_4_9_14_3_um_filter_40_9]